MISIVPILSSEEENFFLLREINRLKLIKIVGKMLPTQKL